MPDVHAPEHRIGGVRDFLFHWMAIPVRSLILPGLEAAYDSAFGGGTGSGCCPVILLA